MSGEFTVTLTYDDYLAANWLRVRRRWFWLGAIRYIAIIAGVTCLIGLPDLFVDNRYQDWTRIVAWLLTGLLFGCVGFGTLMLYFLWCIPRNAKKIYAEQPLLTSPVRYSFDQSGVRIANERESSDLLWSHILNWIESDNLILLSRTRLTFFPIPKSQVDPTVIEALKQCLQNAAVEDRI